MCAQIDAARRPVCQTAAGIVRTAPSLSQLGRERPFLRLYVQSKKLSTKAEGRARKVIVRVEALDNCQLEVVVLFASPKTKFDTNAKLFHPNERNLAKQ